jgi:hypothetical protein
MKKVCCALSLLSLALAEPELYKSPKFPVDKIVDAATHYNDTVVMVAMRDGVTLKTRVFYPDQKIYRPPYTTIYEKSPYSYSDLMEPDMIYYTTLGYVYIGQSSRGREGSNGNYSFFRTSGNDTLDTIQWWETYSQPWGNGMLAVSGISADCISQYSDLMGVTQCGENCWPNGNYEPYYQLFNKIKTGWLSLGSGLGRQTVYQGGAYRNGLVTNWLKGLGEAWYIDVLWEHEPWSEWWAVMNGDYMDQWSVENASIINVMGWYDIFSTMDLMTVQAINTTTPAGARGNQLLVVEPGGHCVISESTIRWKDDLLGWEAVLLKLIPEVYPRVFDAAANGEYFNIHDWVDFNVMFYVLGPGEKGKGTFWVKALGFPEPTPTKYYFTIEQGLMMNKPTTTEPSSLTYTYDPTNPLRTLGGNNLEIQPCGPQDQSLVERDREDVIYFTGPKLGADEYVAICGMIRVNLWVSSTAVDTDFIAKLTDIFPDGREMLVQDSIIRMRWRDDSYEGSYMTEPKYMTPGQVYNATIEVGFLSYIFNPGHQMRVTVSSSNYPRFSVNWNSGLMVAAGNQSWTTADNTLHFASSKYPANVELPIVSLDWLEAHAVTPDEVISKEERQKMAEKGIDRDFVHDMVKRIQTRKLV